MLNKFLPNAWVSDPHTDTFRATKSVSLCPIQQKYTEHSLCTKPCAISQSWGRDRKDGSWSQEALVRGQQPAQFSSVQLSPSVMSGFLQPHESQHARPPCPSPAPGVHSDSRPSSQCYHPAISSSVVPFSSCPKSLPASESFPMSQHFAWGGQSTGVLASASFFPKNTQDWSPLEWTG